MTHISPELLKELGDLVEIECCYEGQDSERPYAEFLQFMEKCVDAAVLKRTEEIRKGFIDWMARYFNLIDPEKEIPSWGQNKEYKIAKYILEKFLPKKP